MMVFANVDLENLGRPSAPASLQDTATPAVDGPPSSGQGDVTVGIVFRVVDRDFTELELSTYIVGGDDSVMVVNPYEGYISPFLASLHTIDVRLNQQFLDAITSPGERVLLRLRAYVVRGITPMAIVQRLALRGMFVWDIERMPSPYSQGGNEWKVWCCEIDKHRRPLELRPFIGVDHS